MWQRLDQAVIGEKRMLSDSLNYFFTLYIDPITENCIDVEHRRLIRASTKLNDFFYYNRIGLKYAYEYAMSVQSGVKIYTLSTTTAFF
jgi:hypothetical protein